ncbi:MAG: YtxH domain-containing protein [Symploca sp. SIO2E9]|nr:YtxH domain-containing protein [Symploca sp. SIO2E9]
MSNKSAGAFIVGLLMGSAVGTVVGLLIAPRKGRDTRQLLKKSADALPDLAEDVSTSVQLQADRLSESALRNWDGTLARLREAIAAGIEASGQERMELQQPNAEAEAISNPSVPDDKL